MKGWLERFTLFFQVTVWETKTAEVLVTIFSVKYYVTSWNSIREFFASFETYKIDGISPVHVHWVVGGMCAVLQTSCRWVRILQRATLVFASSGSVCKVWTAISGLFGSLFCTGSNISCKPQITDWTFLDLSKARVLPHFVTNFDRFGNSFSINLNKNRSTLHKRLKRILFQGFSQFSFSLVVYNCFWFLRSQVRLLLPPATNTAFEMIYLSTNV